VGYAHREFQPIAALAVMVVPRRQRSVTVEKNGFEKAPKRRFVAYCMTANVVDVRAVHSSV